MKVLIVKTSSMGDVIHAMPALTDASRARPDLVFDWCVESAFAPLVRLHPSVRAIKEVSLRQWRKAPLSASTRREAGALMRSIRGEGYDLVVDAQGLFKSAVIARLAGAPVEGFDRRSVREGIASLFYRRGHAVDRGEHAITRQRLLFGKIFGYQPDLGRVDYGLLPRPIAPGAAPTAFLLHGTTWASKRWPALAWAELARGLIARGYIPELTYSNQYEEGVVQAIAAAEPGVTIVPRSPLAEIADRIGRAGLVVGCDSGLTHLAAAFGKPTVAVFLSTSPGLTGVVGRRTEVLQAGLACVPCKRQQCSLVPTGAVQPCADLLTPTLVLSAVDRLEKDTQ